MVDHYAVLEVSRDADAATIKKQYRKLARQYHPDKNDGVESEKFAQITEAAETLTDPRKRELYDRFGDSRAPPKPVLNVVHRITIPQLWGGEDHQVTFQTQSSCHHCAGTGFADGVSRNCHVCRGMGVVAMGFGGGQRAICPHCHGHKPHLDPDCTHCQGGTSITDHTVSVPPPTHLGEMTSHVPLEGEYDLLVRWQITEEDPSWQLEGETVVYTAIVSLADCLCGLRYNFQHPEGDYYLTMPRGKVVQPGVIYLLPRLGPHGTTLGFRFDVEFPEEIAMSERKVVFNYHVLRKALGGEKEGRAPVEGSMEIDLSQCQSVLSLEDGRTPGFPGEETGCPVM